MFEFELTFLDVDFCSQILFGPGHIINLPTGVTGGTVDGPTGAHVHSGLQRERTQSPERDRKGNNKITKLFAVASKNIRLCLAPVFDPVCLNVRETSHYHKKVSLAPFFYQTPVPHALISHGDSCDHMLIQLRENGKISHVHRVHRVKGTVRCFGRNTLFSNLPE